jgi:predicted dehydrogenase
MSAKVKLAIIGCGGISAAHMMSYGRLQEKLEVTALCDVSEANLAGRNKQIGGGAKEFSDWKKMLGELDGGIDAVDICLPHHLHAPAILDAIAAGKHVICEKPMCINLKQADQIVNAVKEKGVVYMSAHNQLFMPAVQEAKRRIDAGEIGKVRWIRSQDCFLAGGGKGNPFAGSWRANAELQGGGELIDTGYHPTYRLLYLAGAPVEAIRGTMGRFQQAIGGEDTASVQVRFANGIIGEILTSWAFSLPYGSYQIHVIGDKGQLFGSGSDLYLLPAGEKEPQKVSMPGGDTFGDQLLHFADCIRTGQRPIHAAEEGRAVLEVILKAAESAEGWQTTAHIQ